MRPRIRNTAWTTAVVLALGAGVVLGQTTFSDVGSDPRSEDIYYAAAQGWFQGYKDGSFRPDQDISETQLARVIRRARPGMSRGDAAVFVRGGMNRLRSLDIAAAAATTTTTTLPTDETGPGETGPGETGPVDPNPPVVIEPTTTTTAPAAATTTTTTQTAGRTLVYGKENGWTNSRGELGDLVWWEFRNWDSSSKNASLAMDYGTYTGYLYIYDGLGHIGNLPYWFRGRWVTRYLPLNFSIARARCEGTNNIQVPCTTRESSTMPDSIRNRLTADGYTAPGAATTTTTTAPETTTTTTTTAPETTTTTTASGTTTTTTQAAGRTLVYGEDRGWRNSRGRLGNIAWWEFRNWDSSSKNARLSVDYGRYTGHLYIYDGLGHVGSLPYWFRSSTASIARARCEGTNNVEVSCTIIKSSTMPDSIRNRLTADGYTAPGAATTTTTTQPAATTTTRAGDTTTTTQPAAATTTTTAPETTTTTTASEASTTTTAAPGRTLVYGKENGWTNSRGESGELTWWEFRNWDSSSKNARLTMSHGGALLIYDGLGHIGQKPYWFRNSRWTSGYISISQARCEGANNVPVSCTTTQSSTMPDSIRNRLTADGYTAPSG